MTQIRDLYNHRLTSASKRILVKHASFFKEIKRKLQADYVTIMILSPDGKVYDIPFFQADSLQHWIDSDDNIQEPVYSYHNHLVIPFAAASLHDVVSYFNQLSSNDYEDNFNNNTFTYHSTHKILANGYILNTTFALPRTIPMSSYHVYLTYRVLLEEVFEYIQIHILKELEKLEEFDISETITPLEVNYSELMPQPLYALSKAENRCFMAIYSGVYENQSIACLLSRSIRTIEGLVASMANKLNCKSRYEMIAKILQSEAHFRYLVANGVHI
ncbi:helix-turn-helix transcriptional regulator [Cysteiniphilum sp. 19S12-1]|uniref:helix-turn-helix transcriptional regulator n=1 Tax=Cysteiniphilum sp. 19S12-1 TaxID=3453130 RepID=UPI003F86BF08